MPRNCFAARLRRDRLQLPILSFFLFALRVLTFFARAKKVIKKNTFKGFPLKDPPASDRALIKRGLLRCARRGVYAVEVLTPFGHISDPKGCAVGERCLLGGILNIISCGGAVLGGVALAEFIG